MNDSQVPIVTPEQGKRDLVDGLGPVQYGYDYGSGKLNGRLLDREHHPVGLAAVAVVLIVARTTWRRAVVAVRVGSGIGGVFVVRGVMMSRSVVMNVRHGLRINLLGRSLARGTPTEERVEVAAAERHRDGQEDRHQKPEWTAALKHTACP